MAFGLATALLGASVGLQIWGASETAKGIRAEGKSGEALQKFNSAQSKRTAKRIRKVGAEKMFQIRTDLREMLARNRVATAGAGVMALGSPLDAELLNIRYAASDIATLEETVLEEAMELEKLAEFQIRAAKDVQAAAGIKQTSAILGTAGGITSTLLMGKLFNVF